MLSAGIVRSDNALVVSFVKLFLFPNLLSCILFAWTCFFIATISTGPSSWGDPLPISFASDSIAQIVAYGNNTPDVAYWWFAFECHTCILLAPSSMSQYFMLCMTRQRPRRRDS